MTPDYVTSNYLIAYITSEAVVPQVKELEREYWEDIVAISVGSVKFDIKQVNQAAKAAGITSPEARKAFGRYIESMKGGKRNDVNFSWKELVELAKEFIDQ